MQCKRSARHLPAWCSTLWLRRRLARASPWAWSATSSRSRFTSPQRHENGLGVILFWAPRLRASLWPNVQRRGAGVAEQGCLLSSYTGKTGVGGSNPPLSARFFLPHTATRSEEHTSELQSQFHLV